MAQPIISDRYPYLRIRVEIRGQIDEDWALVDTGFDGEIIVPTTSLQTNIGREDGRTRWQVGDRRVVPAPSYFGQLEISGLAPLGDVTCVALGDQYILGRGIIDLFKVTFDHGERLVVEP